MARRLMVVLLLMAVTVGCRSGEKTDTTEEEAGPQVLTGTLIRVAAIGGETTGWAVQVEPDRRVEVDLSAIPAAGQYVDRRVTVRGQFTTVRGVEIPTRRVFKVSSLKPVKIHD